MSATATPVISSGRMLLRSLQHRRARSASALAALTVSALVATTLLTLYADLQAKLHHEFRSFGANVEVTATPAADGTPAAIEDTTLARLRQAVPADAIVSPVGYAVATTDRGTPVVVAGIDFASARRLDSYWKLAAWPTGSDTALLGARAAQFIGNEQTVTLTFDGRPLTLNGGGRLTTGGDEDSRVYLPLSTFTSWTHVAPSVVELQIPGSAARIDAAAGTLRQQFPTLRVVPVRALVAGESRIVDRTHALMFGAMLLISLTVGISVLATLSAAVLERRRDFALMKALGASQRQLVLQFLFEALTLAAAGVLCGYLLGSAVAWLIGRINFGTATLPRPALLPVVLFLNLVLATAAALLPARSLRGLEPAALLKGE